MQSFEEFLKKYEPLLKSIAARYVDWSVPFDDLLQEARIALWEIYEKYGPDYFEQTQIVPKGRIKERLQEYAYRERSKTTLDRLDQEVWDGEPETKKDMLQGDADINYVPKSKPLSMREQQVVILKGFQGYTSDEIAKSLEISPSVARRYWIRAKKKLQGKKKWWLEGSKS